MHVPPQAERKTAVQVLTKCLNEALFNMCALAMLGYKLDGDEMPWVVAFIPFWICLAILLCVGCGGTCYSLFNIRDPIGQIGTLVLVCYVLPLVITFTVFLSFLTERLDQSQEESARSNSLLLRLLVLYEVLRAIGILALVKVFDRLLMHHVQENAAIQAMTERSLNNDGGDGGADQSAVEAARNNQDRLKESSKQIALVRKSSQFFTELASSQLGVSITIGPAVGSTAASAAASAASSGVDVRGAAAAAAAAVVIPLVQDSIHIGAPPPSIQITSTTSASASADFGVDSDGGFSSGGNQRNGIVASDATVVIDVDDDENGIDGVVGITQTQKQTALQSEPQAPVTDEEEQHSTSASASTSTSTSEGTDGGGGSGDGDSDGPTCSICMSAPQDAVMQPCGASISSLPCTVLVNLSKGTPPHTHPHTHTHTHTHTQTHKHT
jgi:hypothetical protein